MAPGDRNVGYMTRKDARVKVPRMTQVKNKTPAPVQITAEQILKEAQERQEGEIRPPKQKIIDSNELSEYRLQRRKEFEDQIRRDRSNIQVRVKYAQWEESQLDYSRSRSVWERALEGDYRKHTVWVKYAEFEMKNKFVNYARNVLDRAVTLLPRVDQLWKKYIYMERKLGNIAGARHIFERWMNWSPDQNGWLDFIKFELNYNEVERARSIYQRFVICHPKVSAYIRYAKFEMMKADQVELAREVFIHATTELADDEEAEILFVAYADFEERCKDVERARSIYKSALDRIPKERAEHLYRMFVAFEKRYGNKEGIEEAIVGKRRFQYEDEVRKNPLNYNSWINYALYEEIETKDVERTRDVYRECLKLIPHTKFSFAKIWLLAAQCEIRQLNLTGARQILGNAIGKAPKNKIFKKYIEMELNLGNINRCRKLYERYLEWSPENCYAWRKYAEFEMSLAETERARALFELAISQPALDMPELLWKTYIDFEISEGEFERTRALYERLLDRTKHCKVWVSFTKFEASSVENKEDEKEEDAIDGIRRTRAIFDRANTYYKDSKPELKEERATLLEDWLNMETGFGKLGDVSVVQSKLPKKLKKRKPSGREDGSSEYEEYVDYLFPEESQTTNLKILEAAYKWKKQKVVKAGEYA